MGVTKSFTKTEDGTAITVHFLRPYPKIENTFIFPDVSDISGVEISHNTEITETNSVKEGWISANEASFNLGRHCKVIKIWPTKKKQQSIPGSDTSRQINL